MQSDFDQHRVSQLQNHPDQQHRLQSDSSTTRLQRHGFRIFLGLIAALLATFVLLVAMDDGASEEPPGSSVVDGA